MIELLELSVVLLVTIISAYFCSKMIYRQQRKLRNQKGQSMGRWTPGQSIVCKYCQTVFVMPQGAQPRVMRQSLRPSGNYWVSLDPDDYCPNSENHRRRYRNHPQLDLPLNHQYQVTPPRAGDTTREPRVLLLVPGDRITHAVFGVGEVLTVQGVGEKTEATVRFDSRGVKRLATAWAPITKL